MDILAALITSLKIGFALLIIYLVLITVVIIRAWKKDQDRAIEITFLGTGVKLGAKDIK